MIGYRKNVIPSGFIRRGNIGGWTIAIARVCMVVYRRLDKKTTLAFAVGASLAGKAFTCIADPGTAVGFADFATRNRIWCAGCYAGAVLASFACTA